MNDVPVARQSRDPACPAGQVESLKACQMIRATPFGVARIILFPRANPSSRGPFVICPRMTLDNPGGNIYTVSVSRKAHPLDIREHTMTLTEFFAQNPRCALAFSGGVDSAYLFYAAVTAGADVRAYYLSGPFQPAFEKADALRLADQLGAELTVLTYPTLDIPGVAENPADRCCLCKRAMFTALRDRAAGDGYDLIIDGTNASDRAEDRPGMRALREIGVRSPLRECGLTKADVRRLSREAGLFTWDKPAYSCLATRVAAGERITGETLQKIERAESALFALGFSDLRVRVSGSTAKLQLIAPQLPRALALREKIVDALTPDFSSVTLDLIPREESL